MTEAVANPNLDSKVAMIMSKETYSEDGDSERTDTIYTLASEEEKALEHAKDQSAISSETESEDIASAWDKSDLRLSHRLSAEEMLDEMQLLLMENRVKSPLSDFVCSSCGELEHQT